MIKKLQREHFQKSKTFLYPLLGIKRGSKYKPDETYLCWEGHFKFYDNVLICVYNLVNSEDYRSFEQSVLFHNLYFIDFYYLSNNKVAYCFTLEDYRTDYHLFLDSRYSEMSDTVKKKILNFFSFDIKSQHFHWLNSYLNPERYYYLYAELLNVDPDELKRTRELCPALNTTKETLLLLPKELIL